MHDDPSPRTALPGLPGLPGPRAVGRWGPTTSERSEIRGALRRFLVAGLVTLSLVAVPSALIMRHLARVHTLEGLEMATRLMAENLATSLVDADVLAGEPEAMDRIGRRMADRISDGSVLQVTIWEPAGLVVFSTAGRLIGHQYPEHDWSEDVLSGASAVASFEDVRHPVHPYEYAGGGYVEVDTLFTAATGDELIFEAYFPAAVVHQQQRDMLLRLLPVGLMTLLVLQMAQLPPAARLAGRIRDLQVGRRRLLHQASAASDLERRRIARELHDDVIQQLAGVSYALESVEGSVDVRAQPVVDRSRAILRSTIGTLRNMLVEVYPTDLDSVGLPAAIDALADRLRSQGIEVQVQVPQDLFLDRTGATLLYRVAREAMTNALNHARADAVQVMVSSDVDGTGVTLRVVDDGVGFDTDVASTVGHVGLLLIRDMVREVGGHVDVRSAPGAGTEVVTSIPLH